MITIVRMLSSAVGNMSQCYANLNYAYQHGEPAGDMAGAWWEIDKTTFDHFLEMLPPVYRDGGFSMSEKLIDNISAYFFMSSGRYFCAYVDWNETDAAAAMAWPWAGDGPEAKSVLGH